MSILLIGGEKGGTGKTTIATSLAACHANAGLDTVLIDTDRQGSASYWCALRDDNDQLPRIACVRLHGRSIARQIADMAERYEEVVIDAGGRDSVELRAAMTAANQMITPIQASQFDTWTLESLTELVEQAAGFNADLAAHVCINRASTHPHVDEPDEAAALVGEYDNLILMDTLVRDRIAYRKAARAGMSVAEANDDPKAVAELNHLYGEIHG